jgi:hypothetical protein
VRVVDWEMKRREKRRWTKGGTEVKTDDDEIPDIGMKLQILALKRENMRLQKRIAKLEAENVTLQNRIKVLKKEPKRIVKVVDSSKK